MSGSSMEQRSRAICTSMLASLLSIYAFYALTLFKVPGIMRLAEQGGAFTFWIEDSEDIYPADDSKLM
jgi:hypothetical protein